MSRSTTRREARSKRKGVMVAVGLSLVVLAAACSSDKKPAATNAPTTTTGASTPGSGSTGATTPGSGSTSGTTGGTTGTTTAPTFPANIKNGQGVTDTTVTIGVLMDQSGPLAALAPAYVGAFNANISFINDNGGIAGRKIKTEIIDTKSDPAQILQGFKKFWEQDKVFAIYEADITGPPLDYVKKNNVPVHLLGGAPQVFGSAYPTIIPTGSITPTWNLQADYSVVHYLHKSPKTVAVTYAPYEEPLLDFIKKGWETLGATKVIFDPFPDPTAPCDTLVLKYKDAGVDYWDMHALSFLTCIPAEITANWSPPMGEGGPSTSSYDLSMLVGKPMADLHIIAGSPNTLADGSPRFTTPQPRDIEYQANMKKYAADFTAKHDLNDFAPLLSYTGAQLFIDGITAIAQTGEISPEAFLNWAHTVKNWDPILADVVPSMAPDCKTGNDSTIWGQWTWDDANKKLLMVPFAPNPGEHMVRTSDFLKDLDPCYLTKLADQFYAT